ncbi:LysR family transcriptional regulator [Necropsobacter massiliensis]|uniref:LysR family transcriptional regulator n=1 Tax=Necropsobacter massiliensis TaxID=1400001 RepID=UPI000595F5C1|nr:LysR family transcriptional regulator [Necropsobacter massiliensis]
MDYFSALTAFHTVAETGNFTAAAKQLGVAVSSVTRQIDQLEQSLGTALFHRSTRQIALTNAGVLYLQQTRTILDDLDSANLALKLELDQPQGKLRITFAHAYGSKVLAPILAEFARQYPKIQLEVYGSDEYVDLQAERFDLAVRLGKINDDNLIAKFIAPQQRLLCASPDYLARKGTPQTPDALSHHNCLLYSYRGYVQKWFFRQPERPIQAVNVKGNLLGNSTDILREYALAGIGIAHLPDWLVAEELAEGKLINLLSDWQIQPSATTEEDAIHLLYSANSRQIVKIGVLARFLMERLAKKA